MICKLYAQDQYAIKECCKKYRVDFSTFIRWCNNDDDLNEIYEEAKEVKDKIYFHNIKERSQTSLEKLVMGQTYDEVKIQYEEIQVHNKEGNPTGETITIEAKKTVTQKKILPNTTAVIFALKNADRKNWNDRYKVEHSGGKYIPYSGFEFVLGEPENIEDGEEKE